VSSSSEVEIAITMLKKYKSPCSEVIRGWRKMCNEGYHNLYSCPGIIRMIKSRRIGWAVHVA
jgi:hypothetical protein